MERQKIFWVVLSVSVFVVVVLVVGVLLLRQRSSTAAPVTVSALSGAGTQIYEYQKPAAPGGAQLQSSNGAQPAAGTSSGGQGTGEKPGDQQTMHFYIGEGQVPQAGTTTQPASTPSSAKPATQAPQTAQPQRTAAKPATLAAAKKPLKGIDYWIQTGSYRSQGKAEDLVSLLDGKGLNGRIFSYKSKADTYFRVRIGPYANKGDAEKFLAIVKRVQGLEASYIAQVTVSRPATN
jgi:cell division septation protein DedD